MRFWIAGLLVLVSLAVAPPALANVIEVSLSDLTLTYKGDKYKIAGPRNGVRKPIGTFTIRRKVEWPSWTPTANMLKKNPRLRPMRGGPNNPLGARALYLYSGGAPTMYRIHGTNAPSSIGRNASAGCIRMFNKDVIELFNRVPKGTKVIIRA